MTRTLRCQDGQEGYTLHAQLCHTLLQRPSASPRTARCLTEAATQPQRLTGCAGRLPQVEDGSCPWDQEVESGEVGGNHLHPDHLHPGQGRAGPDGQFAEEEVEQAFEKVPSVTTL
uniref:Uncharacterized protein n=1 Tax=Haptolina brevifila TaxID=156173 RepID=A0A7S2C6H9_9EUKA|mmetsp:Transcript_20898/g.42413  ORF Transcript_20898/g.42413 Transcript_20898/m.42413 type:complete len:116 (+) Transcript_20898:111-458(+)